MESTFQRKNGENGVIICKLLKPSTNINKKEIFKKMEKL